MTHPLLAAGRAFVAASPLCQPGARIGLTSLGSADSDGRVSSDQAKVGLFSFSSLKSGGAGVRCALGQESGGWGLEAGRGAGGARDGVLSRHPKGCGSLGRNPGSFSQRCPSSLGSNAAAPALLRPRGSDREASLARPGYFSFFLFQRGLHPTPTPFPSSPSLRA